MFANDRTHWNRHIEQIIRSKHYTWLGEGLGGDPLVEALTNMLTDVMHICARQGLSWHTLANRSRAQFEREEAQLAEEIVADGSRRPPLSVSRS